MTVQTTRLRYVMDRPKHGHMSWLYHVHLTSLFKSRSWNAARRHTLVRYVVTAVHCSSIRRDFLTLRALSIYLSISLKISGVCLSQLESPPTTSPTNTGNTGSLFYPDYNTPWPDAGCTNALPVPSGRPTYTSHLMCCKGAYGAQVSHSSRV